PSPPPPSPPGPSTPPPSPFPPPPPPPPTPPPLMPPPPPNLRERLSVAGFSLTAVFVVLSLLLQACAYARGGFKMAVGTMSSTNSSAMPGELPLGGKKVAAPPRGRIERQSLLATGQSM
ncbi:MAG: hypothetical protein ACKVI4_14825, partial [Actinomycetales bacterium]